MRYRAGATGRRGPPGPVEQEPGYGLKHESGDESLARSQVPPLAAAVSSVRLAAGALLLGLGLLYLTPAPGALIGAALAAAAATWQPRLGLQAALATLPLHLLTRPLGPFEVPSSELLLLAATVGTSLRYLLMQSRRARSHEAQDSPPASALLPCPFPRPAALFLASGLLSLLVTEYLRLSLRELRVLILEPVLAFYLLRAWFPGRSVAWPLGAYLAGVIGVALAGLVGLPLGWGLTEAEGVRRLQATYQSPNHLGLALGRALPWLLALAWLGGCRRPPALAAALIVGLALLATFSRGAWLGSGAALLVLAGLLGGRRALALAGGAALAAGLALPLLLQVERLRSLFQVGGTGLFRLHLWQSALAMVRDHPLLGIGLDNFLYLYQQRYIAPQALAEANLSHPHNLVLHFWLQLGLLGLIAAGWLLASALRTARATLLANPDRLTRALVAGALGSLTDFLVHGIVDNSYFLPDLALVFWLTLAVIAATRPDTAPFGRGDLPGRPPRA